MHGKDVHACGGLVVSVHTSRSPSRVRISARGASTQRGLRGGR